MNGKMCTYEMIIVIISGLMQISDFGLAKLMPEGQETCVTARVLGTFGYFDPEYTLVCIC